MPNYQPPAKGDKLKVTKTKTKRKQNCTAKKTIKKRKIKKIFRIYYKVELLLSAQVFFNTTNFF